MNGTEPTPTASEVNPKMSLSHQVAPETRAGIISRILFLWAQPLFTHASRLARDNRALEQSDLLALPTMDHAEGLSSVFETEWAHLQKMRDSTAAAPGPETKRHDDAEKALIISLRKVMGMRIYTAGVVKLLNTCLQFAFPLILNGLLEFIEVSTMGISSSTGGRTWGRYDGYWMAALLFIAMGGKALTENWYFHMVYRCGYQARVAVSAAVYKKSLRLSSSSRRGTTLGELVNLLQVDATKIEMFIPQFHTLWDGVVQITGYITILYTLIGWPCFVGLGVMIVAGPAQGVIMGRLFGMNRKMVKYTDARTKTTNEAIQGIGCVKMYTWEESLLKSIGESRDGELEILKSVAYLRGFSRAYMGALPGIVAVVSFVTYATVGLGSINASTLFAALVAFDQLRFPLLFYPMSLAQLAQARVSSKRVAVFLNMAETAHHEDDNGTEAASESEGEDAAVTLENVTAHWSDPSVPLSQTIEGSALDVASQNKKKKAKKSKKDEAKKPTNDESVKEEEPVPRVAPAILKDVTVTIPRGSLCAVVGRVGSGKSSLLSTILSETVLSSGTVSLRPSSSSSGSGGVAYAAQTAWILNDTVRDNVLFGSPMDRERYETVMKACQLTHDLEVLRDGDETEIGERGINLSGGQKQRISVARVAYSKADVVILDDPLSALDPAVAQALFEECILTQMKDRTRILVTNQIVNLRHCDKIFFVKDGAIVEQGSYTELMDRPDGEVRRLVAESKERNEQRSGKGGPKSQEESSKDKEGGDAIVAVKGREKKEAVGLVTKEERSVGAVKWFVYKAYLRAGGGYCLFAFCYFFFILTAITNLLINVVVAAWTSDAAYERFSMPFYMGIYAGAAIVLGLVTFARSYILARFGVSASRALHANLVTSVLHAPLSFFDTTPTGRIISRFSKDFYSIDQELSDYLDFFLFCSLYVAFTMVTVIYATPWFAAAVPLLLAMYVRVLNYFRGVSRETKRLESVSRSPVYASFSETLGGLETIRAYGQAPRFVSEFVAILDENTQAYYCNKSADRWLSIRVELIGALIAGLAAVLAAHVAMSGGDSSFASVAGLSMTYAISVTGLLNWCIRSFAQMEAAMNACERVLYYTDEIPQEAPFTGPELEASAAVIKQNSKDDGPAVRAVRATGGKAVHPPSDWPVSGSLTLQNLMMRYRAETPLVLKGLNVSIAGGERVGIVGRTGSGKSSLLLSLLRLVEPDLPADATANADTYRAPITLDGVDTLRIGLRELRSRMGIIPQNPVLFSGTVRSNLDPFSTCTDEELWNALSGCGMKTAVENLPSQLDAAVAEYGANLSQGQRQLLCLGRALLKKCRVLLLDEATSSVDFETDQEIQRTLRTAFPPGTTVLTIAHRVDTVMDSDKILVMKDGNVAEFASPKELLADEGSLFSDIVRHANNENS